MKLLLCFITLITIAATEVTCPRLTCENIEGVKYDNKPKEADFKNELAYKEADENWKFF